LAVSSTTAKGIEVRDLTGKSAVGSGMIAFVTRGLVLRLVPVVASIRFGAAWLTLTSTTRLLTEKGGRISRIPRRLNERDRWRTRRVWLPIRHRMRPRLALAPLPTPPEAHCFP